jgi:dihydroorotate dehydrogenase (NAD+) catalytic subunit
MQAKIIKKREANIGSGNFLMEFDMGPNVGLCQFVGIKTEFSSLIRPFPVVRKNPLTIAFKIVSNYTKALAETDLGSSIEIFGPFGRIFEIVPGIKSYLLVAGGIGAGPISLIQEYLFGEIGENQEIIEIITLFGAKEKKHLFEINALRMYSGDERSVLRTITDVGPGVTGKVTDLLSEALAGRDNSETLVFGCGSNSLLDDVVFLAEYHGCAKCLVLLEEIFDRQDDDPCKSCNVPCLDGSFASICRDGPFLDGYKVDWDRWVPRGTRRIDYGTTIQDLAEKPLRRALKGRGGRILELDNPVINAANHLSTKELKHEKWPLKFGALITKVLSCREAQPWQGMEDCILAESIEPPNLEFEKFVSEELPVWLKTGKPVIVNLGCPNIRGFQLAAELLAKTGVAGIEISISRLAKYPYIDEETVYQVVTGVRAAVPNLFLITKLSPSAGIMGIIEHARAAVKAKTDAIAAIDRHDIMSINPLLMIPRTGQAYGVKTGPAIHGMALNYVSHLARASLGVPIIAVGGVADYNDAAGFIEAGASAIEIGSAKRDAERIAGGLLEIIKHHGKSDISKLVGTARYF